MLISERKHEAIKIFFFVFIFLHFPLLLFAEKNRTPVYNEIKKQKEESIRRLQDWIRHPSIAAENRGMKEGAQYMMRLAREAGFQKVEMIETNGRPSVFATLSAGAPRTAGIYFMYDVKQADPAE